jgi:hypothetical protein
VNDDDFEGDGAYAEDFLDLHRRLGGYRATTRVRCVLTINNRVRHYDELD